MRPLVSTTPYHLSFTVGRFRYTESNVYTRCWWSRLFLCKFLVLLFCCSTSGLGQALVRFGLAADIPQSNTGKEGEFGSLSKASPSLAFEGDESATVESEGPASSPSAESLAPATGKPGVFHDASTAERAGVEAKKEEEEVEGAFEPEALAWLADALTPLLGSPFDRSVQEIAAAYREDLEALRKAFLPTSFWPKATLLGLDSRLSEDTMYNKAVANALLFAAIDHQSAHSQTVGSPTPKSSSPFESGERMFFAPEKLSPVTDSNLESAFRRVHMYYILASAALEFLTENTNTRLGLLQLVDSLRKNLSNQQVTLSDAQQALTQHPLFREAVSAVRTSTDHLQDLQRSESEGKAASSSTPP